MSAGVNYRSQSNSSYDYSAKSFETHLHLARKLSKLQTNKQPAKIQKHSSLKQSAQLFQKESSQQILPKGILKQADTSSNKARAKKQVRFDLHANKVQEEKLQR
jgi:hypothetical protein